MAYEMCWTDNAYGTNSMKRPRLSIGKRGKKTKIYSFCTEHALPQSIRPPIVMPHLNAKVKTYIRLF